MINSVRARITVVVVMPITIVIVIVSVAVGMMPISTIDNVPHRLSLQNDVLPEQPVHTLPC